MTSPHYTDSSSLLSHTTNINPVVRGLMHDWQQLEKDPATMRTVRSWHLPGSEPVDLTDVLRKAGFGTHSCDTDADQYLFQLVIRAKTCQLAGQIVLQRIMPGVLAIAVRRGRITQGGYSVAFNQLIADTWFVITTYPIDTRPRKVAANILLDAENLAFVREQRKQRTRDKYTCHAVIERLPDDSYQSIIDSDYAEILLLAKRDLSTNQLQTLRDILNDIPTADSARERSVSPRAIRYQRNAVLNQLRSLVLRNLRLLDTTNTLEPAIAKPATIGSRMPSAARGNAATL